MKLLAFLRQTQAWFLVKGSELNARVATLCPNFVMEACAQGRPFCRQITVSAMSLETPIHIAVGGLGSRTYDISKSPYRLGDLIIDQGFVLGRYCRGSAHYGSVASKCAEEEQLFATKILIQILTQSVKYIKS